MTLETVVVACDACMKSHAVAKHEFGPYLCYHCKDARFEEIHKEQQCFDF